MMNKLFGLATGLAWAAVAAHAHAALHTATFSGTVLSRHRQLVGPMLR